MAAARAGLVVLVAVAAAGCARPSRQAASPAPASTPPAVVAEWDGGKLTRDRLDRRVRVMLASAGLRPGTPDAERAADRLRPGAARELTSFLLLDQHHRERPRKLAGDLQARVKSSWDRAVRARGERRLKEALAAWGVRPSDVLEELRLEALRDLYLEALAQEEAVAEEFVRRMYDQNRHLYRIPDRYRLQGLVAKSKEEAERARAELVSGKPFAEVARKYSTDERTRDRGGEVGWLEDTRMQPYLYQAVRHLPKGALSPVFAGPRGWYVVRVVDVRPGRPLSYPEAKPLIVRDFQLQQARITLQALLADAARRKHLRVYWPASEPQPAPSSSPRGRTGR